MLHELFSKWVIFYLPNVLNVLFFCYSYVTDALRFSYIFTRPSFITSITSFEQYLPDRQDNPSGINSLEEAGHRR